MTTTRLLRVGDVQLYRVCDDLSEPLIYFMVLFSPWAFGATQPWAIWTMNVVGYILGALLLGKLAVRHWKGYRPPRWEGSREQGARSAERKHRTAEPAEGTPAPGGEGRGEGGSSSKIRDPRSRMEGSHRPSPISHLPSSGSGLAILTVLTLGYCLISAVNARSTYHRQDLSFEYHRYLTWLPHSF